MEFRKNSRALRAGLTLLELVVVLLILAVLTVMATRTLDTVQDQIRYENNQRSLSEIQDAIGPTEFRQPTGNTVYLGFVSDLGRLPKREGNDPKTQLRELWDGTGLPTYAGRTAPPPDSDIIIGSGWRGPYVRLLPGSNSLTDGWGWPYAITFDASGRLTAVRSRGSDNTDGDSGNPYDVDIELTFPIGQLLTSVTGYVKEAKQPGVKESGNKTETTSPCRVKLFIPDPDTGLITVRLIEAQHPDFTFNFLEVPVGTRVLRAEQTIIKEETGKPTKIEIKRATQSLAVPKGGLFNIEIKLEKISDDS